MTADSDVSSVKICPELCLPTSMATKYMPRAQRGLGVGVYRTRASSRRPFKIVSKYLIEYTVVYAKSCNVSNLTIICSVVAD